MGMTKNDALDFAKKGVRINTLCPGWARLSMLECSFMDADELGLLTRLL
jgi:NAD(P)-dependent dehydrogenase (short-subunit alcohol dehydrogenase family)